MITFSPITPKQVAATLEATPVDFILLGNRNIVRVFSEAVMENCKDKQYWRNTVEYNYRREEARFRTFTDLSHWDKLCGQRADIVILTEQPTENESRQYFIPMTVARLGDIITPRGIYMAHIPEKPKTLEERVAALEELVAEWQKLGFYRSPHPDDDIFKG